MTSRTSYGRSELFACRRTSRVSGLDRESLLTQIASLGILHYRGRRAGAKWKTWPSTWIQRVDVYDHGLTLNDQNKVNHIPVIHGVPHSNLSKDPRKRYLVSIPVTPQSSLVVGSLNVQSLANKAAAIHDCIIENKADIFCTVESWHDSTATPSVIASTPSGYSIHERARPGKDNCDGLRSNYGGICVFVRNELSVRNIDLGAVGTFEHLATFIQSGSSLSMLLVTIYRPGSAAVTAKFFEDFGDLLEKTVVYARCVIAGDVNIQLDTVCENTQGAIA